MKKVSFFVLFFLTAIFILSSCQKESLENDLVPMNSLDKTLPASTSTSRTEGGTLIGFGWLHHKGSIGSGIPTPNPSGSGIGCEYLPNHLCGYADLVKQEEDLATQLAIDPTLTGFELENLPDEQLELRPIAYGEAIKDLLDRDRNSEADLFHIDQQLTLSGELVSEEWEYDSVVILPGEYPIVKGEGKGFFSVVLDAIKYKRNDEIPLPKACECENNLVQNGDFTQGTITNNTNIPSSNPTAWSRGYGSPQYYDQMGYTTPRFIAFWGNQTVGEAIYQQVNFVKGKTYEFCFAFQSRGKQANGKQPYMSIKLRAAKQNNLNSPTGGTVIGISQDAYTVNGWATAHITWTADDDYRYLYVSPENEFAVNHGQYTSFGIIDDFCIKEACEDLVPYTDFKLVNANVNGTTISQAIFTAPAAIPQGAVHWWNVFEGESCEDDGNYAILNENSNPVELRNTHFGNTFTINSPDGSFPNLEVNKCYIIKHGVYKDGCSWEETRAKFRVTFSINLKTGKPQINFVSEGSIEQPNANNAQAN